MLYCLTASTYGMWCRKTPLIYNSILGNGIFKTSIDKISCGPYTNSLLWYFLICVPIIIMVFISFKATDSFMGDSFMLLDGWCESF